MALKLRTVKYFFNQTFLSMMRNFWMSLASVGTVAITLLILGGAFLTMVNASFIATSIESDVEINVYLEDSISEYKFESITTSLEKMPGVSEITFVPKDEALKGLKQDLNDNGEILQALGDHNPLPDTYRVKTVEPSQVPQIAQKIEALPGVEKVNYGQGVVENLFNLTRWVKTAGLVVMGVLFLAAIYLISTTIRLTVFARREEIEIMRFLGATNWFIRWPFLLEGVFLGFLGSLIAVVFIYFGYGSLVDNIKGSFNFIPLIEDISTIFIVAYGLLGIGVIIGALGSIISMHKHLKV